MSGEIGEGPNCARLRAEADTFRTTAQLQENVKDLAALRQEIARLETQLMTARAVYDAALNGRITDRVQERRDSQREIGLLERFDALHRLIDERPDLRAARWIITLLFITIDCLPIVVKFLGASTHYERMLSLKSGKDERVFAGLLLSEERADTLEAEIRRHADEARVVQEKAKIDEQARLASAHRDLGLDADIDALAAKLLAQDTKAWQEVPYPRVIDLDESPDATPPSNGHRASSGSSHGGTTQH